MARIAIGDIQGCLQELQQLTKEIRFKPDRDRLWLVGDLVNRGPDSLGVLRWIKSLGDSAQVVLGNHDLHLLAVAFSRGRRLRKGDTLEAILEAPDRDDLLEWLLGRPLAVAEGSRDIMVHAGVPPQWTREDILQHAAETHSALQRDPAHFFEVMYGNEPDIWSDSLTVADRWRFTINALTRMRYCEPEGRLRFSDKGPPGSQTPGLVPWFDLSNRRSRSARIIFGHWSALGLIQRDNLLGLDTGCIWGGALTAVDLDDGRCWQVASLSPRQLGDD
jgi:bis(5'-nucleosyl)-tetraphosphatase (symmetrical)